jgi:hypothetical protein
LKTSLTMEFTSDDGWFPVTTYDGQLPTPTSQKLRIEQKFGFTNSTITDVSMHREYNDFINCFKNWILQSLRCPIFGHFFWSYLARTVVEEKPLPRHPVQSVARVMAASHDATVFLMIKDFSKRSQWYLISFCREKKKLNQKQIQSFDVNSNQNANRISARVDIAA